MSYHIYHILSTGCKLRNSDLNVGEITVLLKYFFGKVIYIISVNIPEKTNPKFQFLVIWTEKSVTSSYMTPEM